MGIIARLFFKELEMTSMLRFVASTLLICGISYAAPAKPSGNVVSNLQKGSVTNGAKATGSLNRWMIFNEGLVGGSWTKIGRSEFISVDLGYSSYIATVATAGGLRGVFGVDFEFPLYLSAKGQSNALETHRGFSDVFGWGAIVPLSAGIDVNGFFLKGLVGYSYHSIQERFDVGNVSDAEMTVQYHGVVYGAALGYKIKNILAFKAEALFGEMLNDHRSTSNATLSSEDINKNKKYNYMKLGASVSIIF